MLRRAVSAFFRRGAALLGLMLGISPAVPPRPAIDFAQGRARTRSGAGKAGARRLAAMNISPAHSSSVRKLQRAERIRARIAAEG
jgi:hypothetical protein